MNSTTKCVFCGKPAAYKMIGPGHLPEDVCKHCSNVSENLVRFQVAIARQIERQKLLREIETTGKVPDR